jgi:hypothetical protein
MDDIIGISWAYIDGLTAPCEGEDYFDPGKVDASLWRRYQHAEKRWRKLLREVREQSQNHRRER